MVISKSEQIETPRKRLAWQIAALLALPFALGISGCQEIHNLNQMAANTNDMTGKISQTDQRLGNVESGTNELTNETNELSDETCDLYVDLRQNDSLQTRQQALDWMDQAPTLQAKVNDAAVYLMGFEFQLIKDNGCDTPASRDVLYDSAFLEFFQDLSRYMPDPSVTVDPTSTTPASEGLLSLSAVLDRVNPNRAMLDQQEGKTSVSFLSLIQETLELSNDLETGKIQWASLPSYQQDILENQQAATQILRARAGFLPAMLLSQITTVTEHGWLIQAWMAYMGTKVSFDSLSVADLDNIDTWIRGANDELDYLSSQGIPFGFNSNLQTFYKNLVLPVAGSTAPDLKLPEAERGARTQAEQQLLDDIHSFRKRIGAE